MNVDVAYTHIDGSSAYGGILRNYNSEFICDFYCKVIFNSYLFSMWTFYNGVLLYDDKYIRNVIFRIDYLTLFFNHLMPHQVFIFN